MLCACSAKDFVDWLPIMNVIAAEPWSWMLFSDGTGFIVVVTCGSVGLFDVSIRLTPDEASSYAIEEREFISRFASEVARNPSAFDNRCIREFQSQPDTALAVSEWIMKGRPALSSEQALEDGIARQTFSADDVDVLPPRLKGFFESLAAISHGQYPQGGLAITFPASFDRNNLEVTYVGRDTDRSAGSFVKVDIRGISIFLNQVLGTPSQSNAVPRIELAEKLVQLLTDEMVSTALEFWYHDGGYNATLSICLSPGDGESWLELYWCLY